MKRWITSYCIVMLLLSLLCACSSQPNDTDQNDVDIKTENTDLAESTNAAVGSYIGNYENEPLYQKMMEIEKCTDPDALIAIIEKLYDEEFSCLALEIEDHGGEKTLRYKEPYADVLCVSTGFYNSFLGHFPVQTDTYLFFKGYSEQPLFMMDTDGTCIVHSYGMHTFADDETVSLVEGYVISDLYLALHGYINDTEENKASATEKIQAIDVYMDFENRVSSSIQ